MYYHKLNSRNQSKFLSGIPWQLKFLQVSYTLYRDSHRVPRLFSYILCCGIIALAVSVSFSYRNNLIHVSFGNEIYGLARRDRAGRSIGFYEKRQSRFFLVG